MNLALVIVGILLVAGAGVIFAQQARALVGTIIGAIGILMVVAGWVRLDSEATTLSEALRTGGLAAAAAVALYGLWLADRRRRIDEERQDIERRRHDLETQRQALEQTRQTMETTRLQHERERSTDERFARSIELLGAEADQVRVGAMHALAGLARSRPEYTQTVLDVLCAYLRRPFDHAHYARLRGADDVEESMDADRERQVRLTAQRLIGELLPESGNGRGPTYDLDLTGATLEYFDISERVVGQLTARSVNLYEANAFGGMEIYGDAWFTSAHSWGKFIAQGTTFHKRAWFSNFEADQLVDFKQSKFDGVTKLAQAKFDGRVVLRGSKFAQPIDLNHSAFLGGLDMTSATTGTADTHGMVVALDMKNELPQGWVVDQKDDGLGLVRT